MNLSALANVGVIAGIILLAYELEQNNNLLRAEASHNLLRDRTDFRSDLVNASDEVLEFWVRVSSNAPLTAADELRLNAAVEATLLNWQYQYGQYVDGNLSAADLPIEAFRAAYRGEGSLGIRLFPEVWRSFRARLRPDFVQWMEANVVNQ